MVQKKTAIVTSSSKGIGKETAILLGKKGVNIVICSRNQSQINTTLLNDTIFCSHLLLNLARKISNKTSFSI